MKEREVAAEYRIADDPSLPGMWTDLTESDPRTRVRVAAGRKTPVTVIVFKDGTFESDGKVESDTTYGKKDENEQGS